MSVEISSSFQITVDVAITAGTAIVIQNQIRSMRVVSVEVTGQETAVVSVGRLRNGVTDVFASGTLGANAVNQPILVSSIANATFQPGDDIDIGSATADTLQVILHCTGSPSQQMSFA